MNERREQRAQQRSFFDEITFDAGPVVHGRRREGPDVWGEEGSELGRRRGAKAIFQPLKGPAKAELLHVHDQVDGTIAATPWFQLMNLAPVTERNPRAVRHLADRWDR